MKQTLLHGDCLERLKELPDNSVDAVVTDPPYGLSFMGKKWDYDVPSEDVWRECLRALKPGGHLLAFAGTRTQHRMAVRIEDAGFEIRDLVMWHYGSGFPKSLDVSKAIDKAAGAERELTRAGQTKAPEFSGKFDQAPSDLRERRDKPATDAARQWQGWGTALKPATEIVTVARKPLNGTVAANVLAHGTGAINIDGCRVAASDKAAFPSGIFSKTENVFGGGAGRYADRARTADVNPAARFPANLIHDGSDEVVGLFPQTGPSKSTPRNNSEFKSVAKGRELPHITHGHDDNGGSAARFFYCAKASKKDRNEGLDGFRAAKRQGNRPSSPDETGKFPDHDHRERTGNFHPTVKPTALMRYLCRLVTPPGGTVLDPFMGSGSTGKAAMLEGFQFIGIERESEYLEIAKARILHAEKQQGAEKELPLVYPQNHQQKIEG